MAGFGSLIHAAVITGFAAFVNAVLGMLTRDQAGGASTGPG